MSIQIHGGLGYIEESGVSQPLRDVRVAAIYEGTTSIQAHDLVDRKLMRDGGASLRAWLSQVHATLNQLGETRAPELAAIGARLRTATEALQAASAAVLANYRERPIEVLAGSVPLLSPVRRGAGRLADGARRAGGPSRTCARPRPRSIP